MNGRPVFLLLITFLLMALLFAGCTTSPGTGGQVPPSTAQVTSPAPLPGKITTTAELTAFVAEAAEHARKAGTERAISDFNKPGGAFTRGGVHIFAIGYNGTLLADPTEPAVVGSAIGSWKDSFGSPFIGKMAETARFGRGYVSYTYPDPALNNTFVPRLAAVEDVDGTYYVAAGMFATEGDVYPSTTLRTDKNLTDTHNLVNFVREAVSYARANGREKAFSAFNDPKGMFSRGELVILAFDDNGTNLAGPPFSPELSKYHINLLNYQDPDGITTIRGLRDLAKGGGGFLYTVASVTKNNTTYLLPKIDYAEPVDDTWWVLSGIVLPEYTKAIEESPGALVARNHTREELFALVNRTVTYAKVNGKDKTLAAINDHKGPFIEGDLFVWAESSDGVILADPFLQPMVGENFLNYTDSHGMMTTRVGLMSMKNSTGFSHAMFPNTALNGTAELPKLVYMKPVDDTWWIGSGIYGIEIK